MKPIEPAAYDLLQRGALVLARIEQSGIRIDTDYLQRALAATDQSAQALAAELRADPVHRAWEKRYAKKTNLDSLAQLATVLFEDLGLPYHGDRTATGRHKADAETLRGLRLPFVQKYLERARLLKLRNTFLAGIEREVVDGYLHPFFDLHTARTYRGASSAPNFQNLPIRDPLQGKVIRRCFVPRPGRVLAEVDFSTLEFRGAACMWRDPEMIAYASDPKKDIHRDESMRCYLLAQDQVSKPVRSIVKNKFVFPVLYGSYYVNTARDLWDMISRHDLRTVSGLPLKKHLRRQGLRTLGACDSRERPVPGTFEHHIQQVEQQFFDRFSVFAAGKERWWQQYLRRGWFPLITGFVCQGLYSKNNLLNYSIQGSCFHCLLWSLIELQAWLRRQRMQSVIVGQIHDCILLDALPDELQDVLEAARRLMTVKLRQHWDWIVTPLSVEVDVTPVDGSWFHKSPWVRKKGCWVPKEPGA